MPNIQLVHRTIKAKKGASGWSGPGKALYLLFIPDGVEWSLDRPLRESSLSKAGVTAYYCGSYYWDHTGPKSSYGKALRHARSLRMNLLSSLRGGMSDPFR